MSACAEGRIQSPPSSPGSVSKACAPTTPRRLRRLTNTEYARAVSSLVGEPLALVSNLPPDPTQHGFDNAADLLFAPAEAVEEYARLAQQIALRFPVSRQAPCPTGEGSTCAVTFARGFGQRAYARPLRDDEVNALTDLYAVGAKGGGHDGGIRLIVEAVLQSPHFLYRTELGSPEAPDRLTSYEIATQLSFFLTGDRPDEALLRAAAEPDGLRSPERLAAETRRLLGQPAARLHLRGFLQQWLGLADFESIGKTDYAYPEFLPAVRADMKTEAERFLDHALSAGGTLEALFGAKGSFVNQRLASVIYKDDLTGPAPAEDFGAVTFDPSRRRGVLSLPALLTAHATIDRTSPVERGLFVRYRLLCAPPIPPPPPGLPVGSVGAEGGRTTRQKVEQHVSSPACRGCHQLIDPIGFGLENMDGIGRFRTQEHGLPVDARGALVGSDVDGPFSGPAGLTDRLLRSRTFSDCVVTQLFRFQEAREETEADRCELAPIQEAFARGRRSLADLAVDLVLRPGFAKRRAEASP